MNNDHEKILKGFAIIDYDVIYHPQNLNLKSNWYGEKQNIVIFMTGEFG